MKKTMKDALLEMMKAVDEALVTANPDLTDDEIETCCWSVLREFVKDLHIYSECSIEIMYSDILMDVLRNR